MGVRHTSDLRTGRRGRRVLIIVQNLSVPLDRRVWQESLALVRAGFGVSVICPRDPGEARREDLEGVHIYRYDPPPVARGVVGYAREFVWCWLRTALLSVVVLARHGFDVIQACNPPDTYFALALLYRPLGKRFVFDHHDLCPELFDARFPSRRLLGRAVRLLERLTFLTAHHVIETNQSHREVAMTRGRRTAGDVTIVRSGPDLDRLRRVPDDPTRRAGREHLCCYVGIMGHQDGVETIVRAARVIVHEMGRKDIHFALMGFGDCYDALRELTTELDLDEFVTFTGKVGNEELAAHLSSATIGLSPDPKTSFNEHCTMNKTLEYMAFSLPVVSFDLRENRFSAGDAAFIVDTPGPTAFAKAIVELVDDPERREAMGAVGRARIEGELAWQRQASIYVDVYERLLAGSATPVTARTSPAARPQS